MSPESNAAPLTPHFSCPVLGICGFSGSGKTTLLEEIIPLLVAQGLSVAVVKHDVHGVDLDRVGKDSERLFKAGADVLLHGPDEAFIRSRQGQYRDLPSALKALSDSHDLILVEGHKDSPCQKIWLQARQGHDQPLGITGVVDSYAFDHQRAARLLAFLKKWLPQQWQKVPVYGCILIGGKSRRMGRDKHLIQLKGKTWLEHTSSLLEQVCVDVVISGAGKVPESLSTMKRLPDIPALGGPLAGMLACMRWAPGASWLVSACDMPGLSLEALTWLLASRKPGVWGILPKRTQDAPVEPLLALYDFRARHLLEEQIRQGRNGPRTVASHAKISCPVLPAPIMDAWRNINIPDELDPPPV